MLEKNLDPKVITDEEGYELIQKYVEFFWRSKKFFSLEGAYDMMDVVNTIFIKFKTKNLFGKYNPEITSKKYHIMNSVRTSMIDLLRAHKPTESLDKEDENGITLMEKVSGVGGNIEADTIGNDNYNTLMDLLSDETRSTVMGHSPILGECKMTHRAIAQHLEAGFKIQEIASFFINPKNMKPVTEGRIHQLVDEIRSELSMAVAYMNR